MNASPCNWSSTHSRYYWNDYTQLTDMDVIIRPRIALQTSESRILIYRSKKDEDKFGVMTIE
jgi:hypothetical protein